LLTINLLECRRKTILIKALILRPIERDRRLTRLHDDLNLCWPEVQKKADYVRKFLVTKYGRYCPRIEFKTDSRPASLPNLAEYFEGDETRASYRALADLGRSAAQVDKSTLHMQGITYLVALEFDDLNKGWFPGRDQGSVQLKLPASRFIEALEDIVTDIVFFYSFSSLRNSSSVEIRADVARESSRYAKLKGLDSKYGEMHGETGYFCMASTIDRAGPWTDRGLHQLNDLWTCFLDWMVQTQPGSPVSAVTKDDSATRAEMVVKYVLENCPRAGQIDVDRLRAQATTLSDESMVFVMYARKARPRVVRRRLESIFGSNYRMNAWRFVPNSEHWLKTLRSVRPYIFILYIPCVAKEAEE